MPLLAPMICSHQVQSRGASLFTGQTSHRLDRRLVDWTDVYAIGLLDNSAGVSVVVPPGPLAAGAFPVPPVRSTAAFTPGPQAPLAPAMLQSTTFLVFSLQGGASSAKIRRPGRTGKAHSLTETVKPSVKTCFTQAS